MEAEFATTQRPKFLLELSANPCGPQNQISDRREPSWAKATSDASNVSPC
jgi:hypothetical protein